MWDFGLNKVEMLFHYSILSISLMQGLAFGLVYLVEIIDSINSPLNKKDKITVPGIGYTVYYTE